MSLGTGALKGSGVPDAISHREVSMATLESGNHPIKTLLLVLGERRDP